jgi:hypothetical protein
MKECKISAYEIVMAPRQDDLLEYELGKAGFDLNKPYRTIDDRTKQEIVYQQDEEGDE